MVTNPLKMLIFVQSVQKLHSYAVLYSICAHFSHASIVLQLNLPHHDSFGLGVSAVAMVTNHPKLSKMPIFGQFLQKLHSYAVLQHMCTLFTCFTRFAVEFATP